MTMNQFFWGTDVVGKQLEFLNKFDTVDKVKIAFHAAQSVCMNILTGVINHMAPAGQRMPELTAITLLEQIVR
jgi:hypothetical protein